MEMAVAILLFVVGLVVIVKGGDILVGAALKVSSITGISQIIIGATLVSLATTMPEILVSSIAAVSGEHTIAVGNAIGSVIANSGIVLGLSLTFMPTKFKTKQNIFKLVFLLFACFLYVLTILDGKVTIVEGIVLILIFFVFMFLNLKEAKKEINFKEEFQRKDNKRKQAEQKNKPAKKEFKKLIAILVLQFLFGSALLFAGAQLMVNYGSKLAELFGVSKHLIALTLIAFGTSLPELITIIASIKKKSATLALGNVVGANIINLTLLSGSSALLSGEFLSVNKEILTISVPFMLAISLIISLPVLLKNRTYKWQGISIIALNIIYLILLVILNV